MKRFVLGLSAIGVFSIQPIVANAQAAEKPHYSLRHYQNVTHFYTMTAQEAVKIGLANNVPPAAILAIAGWESGYGQGYVAQVTGNIMSLGARKGEPELPPLTLPKNRATDQIMIDIDKAKRLPKDQVVWEKRPPSLKKDYRPKPYAGTADHLLYFRNHPQALKQAYAEVMQDFASRWINAQSDVPVFATAAGNMNQLVKREGQSALLKCDVAKAFVKSIGGQPRSFNTRPAWITHVNTVMDKAGLCQLTQELYQGQSFKIAWVKP